MPTPDHDDLQSLRQRIDGLDAALVKLLSERAEVVEQVGRAKRSSETPIYAPHRERAVLDRVKSLNPGPLPNQAIEAIWRELMSGSFAIEQPLTVAFLGPPGSFSHIAAIRHFGSSVEVIQTPDIEAVFHAVATGQSHYGVVPYENSIVGGVIDTLDAFVEQPAQVCAESMVEVTHCLMAKCPPSDIQRIASKPQALAQCRKWLQDQFPNHPRIPTSSSAAAVELAAQETGTAAIGSRLAGQLYDVPVVADDIGDKPSNLTRFLVIGSQQPAATGEDRTSIMFVTRHDPGALVDVLAVFREAGINLSHIDKRPSGRENWEYTFFIDADAHRDEQAMANALEQATALCTTLRVLGSYPRAHGVLHAPPTD